MFEYFSKRYGTPGRLFRLNYAIDMRYGVLHDIATKVFLGKPIDVSLGHVNFIWQGDASVPGATLPRALRHADLTDQCQRPRDSRGARSRGRFGKRFGREPLAKPAEEPTAWLTNTSQAVNCSACRSSIPSR